MKRIPILMTTLAVVASPVAVTVGNAKPLTESLEERTCQFTHCVPVSQSLYCSDGSRGKDLQYCSPNTYKIMCC
ncbi:Protein of unknown function [Pyronema omphalodes CBS 100304]|uniref:Uncharacterized protein n=1 Tax=Pyronema omphalodes (strain CBS 100304) TaxID=1076935 RepID=U4LDL0_PYROM|nr:Protein of unknown function [Pyronema omphalodes CBS 100304]